MTVNVVHCVDTEGPLDEKIKDTFKRLNEIFGIDIKASKENLKKLQNMKIPLNGLEKSVAKVVNKKNLNYQKNWKQIDKMLDNITSQSFRLKYKDSFGKGWVFSWFCLDHVGFEKNPRSRDLGYHKIFDHYRKRKVTDGWNNDEIGFHYHPLPFSKQANHCATHWWSNGQQLFEILSRRIIERQWFPTIHRPGFHVCRPESNWFLEQFIPFDFSNQATKNNSEDNLQKDLNLGRFGDWRRAPRSWEPYNPSFDDYQKKGNCRRFIFRCLNVGTRIRLLSQQDVYDAFKLSKITKKEVVLAFTNHDFREMEEDIKLVYDYLKKASLKFKDVKWRNLNAKKSAIKSLNLKAIKKLDFDLEFIESKVRTTIRIKSSKKIFGPQPFLALKNKKGFFFHDNFDIHTPFCEWSYTLDKNTIEKKNIESFGFAANDNEGQCCVINVNPHTGKFIKTNL